MQHIHWKRQRTRTWGKEHYEHPDYIMAAKDIPRGIDGYASRTVTTQATAQAKGSTDSSRASHGYGYMGRHTISKTEQYLLQEHPWAAQGRGANLQAVIKPGTHQTRTNMEKGQTSILGATQGEISASQKHPAHKTKGPVHGFMQAVRDVRKHWVGPPTWGRFLDTCRHWRKRRDPHAADLMIQTMHHQLQEAQQLANDESIEPSRAASLGTAV